MIQTIEELAVKRQKWVEANRENRFEAGLKSLLTDLYPDNAHFIYELLQNAEDARAQEVRFILHENRIEFEHDGERLFSFQDVEAITSIGSSIKRDDTTTIGKFGVGFKAVFAYTSTPEIHSGEFHFRIHDLVVPVTNGVNDQVMGGKKTCFIFPFDHPTKQPSQAVNEIKLALRSLGDNTLLFLSHIYRIEYKLPDGSLGSLKRIDHNKGHIEVQACHPGGEKTVSHWLLYQKDVEVIDEDGRTRVCRIAIAYNLQQEDKKKKNLPEWKIVPLDHGQVSIYFPAEKESSNLRFHIHAPFASTVARDSVRDCDSNRQLRDCIAELAVGSLTNIRDRGMLTMGFLAVLPNKTDNLSTFYEPIRSAIVYAFKDEPFTPTRSGIYAPATELYRGPSKIAETLDDEGLSLLTNYEPPLWAANPPQQNQREDRFLDSLEIDEWGWSELSIKISYLDADERKTIESWIALKDDAWVMRFYALLGEVCDVHFGDVNAEDFRIVRVEAGQVNEHVLPRDAFFPPDQETTTLRDLRFVKPTVYSGGRSEAQKKYAVSFLEHIGVRPFDAKTIIELRLCHYETLPKQVYAYYFKDLKQFIDFWKKNPADADLFKQHSFLLGESPSGTLNWRKPAQLCMDLPYSDTGLKELTDIHKKQGLWSAYKENLNESLCTDFVAFLQAVGVMYRVDICKANIYDNPNYLDLISGAGTKETSTRIREDYTIDALDGYMKLQYVAASRLVWLALIRADSQVAKARYRRNQQYQVREVDSQLVHHLKTCSWIPDKSGAFHKPEEMNKDNLRTDFPYDNRNGLLTAIRFGERAKKHTEDYTSRNDEAQKMGFQSADEAQKMARLAQLMRENGQSLDRFLEHFQPTTEKKQPSFPSRPGANPNRRQERLGEQISAAPDKKYEKLGMSVRTSNNAIDPITWLRNQYTNEVGQMVCQVCKEEMPFRKLNRLHYFEKKELLSLKYLPKEHEAQYLALCPVCAAKYEEFVKTDDDRMAKLKEAIVTSKNCEIPISLGDQKTSIRFVEIHLHDLQTILLARNSIKS